MSFWLLAFLIASTVLGALISSMFGLAGGTVLFFLLTLALDAKLAIPLHAGVQLIANGARLGAYFKSIEWRVVGWFSILLLPGALLGGQLYMHFEPAVLEWLIGIFILISIFAPRITARKTSNGTIVALGFISGFLGMIVAVTGPLIASFFNMNNLTRERLVATKSFCQGVAQLAKMIVFSTAVGFDFGNYQSLIIVLGVAAVVGTFTGKFLLKYMSDQKYQRVNTALFIMIAAVMLLKPVYSMIAEGWPQ